MSSLGSPNPFFIAGKKAYEVERSLRFNDDDTAYLSRDFGSGGNRKKWTFSAWIKRGNLGGSAGEMRIFGGDTNASHIFIASNDELTWDVAAPGSSASGNLNTTQLFRDPSAWFHLVCALDTDESTADNRMRMYVNGAEITDFGSRTNPSSGYALNAINADGDRATHTLGYRTSAQGSAGMEFDGYMAEINFIDGQQYDASYFGKTDPITGQWNPKKYTGGYGTTGFYLNFSDNSDTSATTLGKDSSGNGNNWTPNNFSVAAGKDDDSSFDSPTNNFPTLSPVDRSLVGTISNGSLRVSYNYKPASKSWRSTMALPSTGKIYWEWENEETTAGRWQTGLVRYTDEAGVVDFQGYNDVNYVSISFGGSTWNGTTHMSSWPSFSFYSGERAAIAIDCSNGKLWVGKVASNGSTTWYANDGGTDGDPAGGTNESFTIPNFTTATEWMPHIVWHDGGGASSTTFTSNINFGNHSFLGTVPTGFGKLCSANLSDPTILLPSEHFDTLLYTGDGGASRALAGLSFQPDWGWFKSRSSSANHDMYDSVRGGSARLIPNDTSAESSYSNLIQSFNSDGYTLGTSTEINGSGLSLVAWNWKAGGTASSNSDGSITSSVSANTTAGFSIVSYTGTGANATVGHGLGVAPQAIILKERNSATAWYVYHKEIGATKQLKLNTSDTSATNDRWQDTHPTSSLFYLDDATASNGNGDTYIAYCFSEVAGYSKVGKYTGNGSANGTFVFTGFRPAFVLIKNSSSSVSWVMGDNKRDSDDGGNPVGKYLHPNSNAAESQSQWIDFTSNGFKLRSSATTWNGSGNTLIYLAFAESPFKYARAR